MKGHGSWEYRCEEKTKCWIGLKVQWNWERAETGSHTYGLGGDLDSNKNGTSTSTRNTVKGISYIYNWAEKKKTE